MPHDVSVIVRAIPHLGRVAIVGDLFECEADLQDPIVWQRNSWNVKLQNLFRSQILEKADFVVPGHGDGFKV